MSEPVMTPREYAWLALADALHREVATGDAHGYIVDLGPILELYLPAVEAVAVAAERHRIVSKALALRPRTNVSDGASDGWRMRVLSIVMETVEVGDEA